MFSYNKVFYEPQFSKLSNSIDYSSSIFLIGSCFSENIFNYLKHRKFSIASNPYGILFDTLSIEKCISEIVANKKYSEADLFYHNELYGSWAHHTQFCDTDSKVVLNAIQQTIEDYHSFLNKASHIVVTLGSAFSYYHLEEQKYVANCHKVPQKSFRKDLVSIEKILGSLESIRKVVASVNPKAQLILTISPVRHLRDGLIDNNRSKARLIEAVNQFIQAYPEVYYFPSYEIVIDVLRDYRFYDIDFAHPNYLATDIVFDYFKELCINERCNEKMQEFYQLYLAKNHRPRQPKTQEHKRFLETHLAKAKALQKDNASIDLAEEILYFSDQLEVWTQ